MSIQEQKLFNINTVPTDLVIKDHRDLIEKLEIGMKDTDNMNVCSIEEAFAEIEEILAN